MTFYLPRLEDTHMNMFRLLTRYLHSLFRPVPSPSVLIRSAHDQRELRRIADILRPDLPGSVSDVRKRAHYRALLASQPQCPLGLLATLARDPDPRVRQVAERHLYDQTPSARALGPRFAH